MGELMAQRIKPRRQVPGMQGRCCGSSRLGNGTFLCDRVAPHFEIFLAARRPSPIPLWNVWHDSSVNRPPSHKAVSAKRPTAFLEPCRYGLGYACQREGSFDRLQRRAAMLNRQLGGIGWATWESPPPKPKWMRWRTYERKYEGWRRVVERADAEFTIKAMRILRRPVMPIPIGRRRQPHR